MDREILRSISPPPSSHVWRTAAATLRGFLAGRPPADMLKSMYPDDLVAPLVLARAASTQAVLTNTTWAEPLAHYAVSDAVQDIVSMSALDKLARAGAMQIDMGNIASVVVPGRVVNPANAKAMWVGEGGAVPVNQYTVLGPSLNVHKVEANVVVTRELSEASNIENVLRMLLTEMGGLAIDAAMWSTDAASAAKSAGLLAGLTALTPTTGGAGFDGCGQDLGALTADIASRGGGRFTAYVAAPAQATAMRFWAGGQFSLTPGTDVLPIAASATLPDGTVIAVEPSSLAYAIGAPAFSVSNVTALQMDDAPTGPDLIAGGTGHVKSMWQTDSLVLRMSFYCDFVMRAPHVATMSGVAW